MNNSEQKKCRCSCHVLKAYHHTIIGEMISCDCAYPNNTDAVKCGQEKPLRLPIDKLWECLA